MSKIIGLTGGIGAGKSKILSVFENFGVPCYNSDIKAKNIMENDLEVKKSIINLIGPDSYFNNNLNTPFISHKVFNNSRILKLLNEIIHPKVKDDFFLWIKFQKKSFVIIETAILFESGLNLKCDKIILVSSPLKLRLDRIIKRDKMKKNDILKRINNQLNFDTKIKDSDFIINNINWDNTLNDINKILNILNKKFN
jgi:dephospho-CoA kinase